MRISRKGRTGSLLVMFIDDRLLTILWAVAVIVTDTVMVCPGWIVVFAFSGVVHSPSVSTSLIIRSDLPVFSIMKLPLAVLPIGLAPRSTSEGSILIDGLGSSSL